MRSRRNPKRRMTGKHFAQIPVEVLTSEACKTLGMPRATLYRKLKRRDVARPPGRRGRAGSP